MDRLIFLFLAAIFAGFALVEMPLAGTFLASIEPFTTVVGVLAILVFSFVLIYNGVKSLFNK
ncbi:hypothetical protein AB1K32_14740 [Metabacillus dongyingensis]|jgi:hypothetical protein|uniref:hypothetical protein n=1 Tax=Metabacillus dongyingensis TaxID=2874282 RepID=UPI003B8CECA6